MDNVKNYIVLKNYNLTDRFFIFDNMEETHNRYKQMEETLVESAHLFVKDLDEIIIDRETVKHDQIMFKHHMQLLDDRFHSEKCNILYCDLDIVFTQPFQIFNKYSEFSMLEHQCGIRYYPHTMSEHLWDIQRTLMKDWDETIGPEQGLHFSPSGPYNWSREQEIYSEFTKDILDPMGRNDRRRQLREFKNNIHCVYNEYPSAHHPSMIHYNGTAPQFDPVQLAKDLLDLAKDSKLDAIRELMSSDLYCNMSHNPHYKSLF
jgi:hypothetical protein|tara:strand:+ start:107 stop:889 length:783 start_codon:yes stop_codon:yes gene_type:complete